MVPQFFLVIEIREASNKFSASLTKVTSAKPVVAVKASISAVNATREENSFVMVSASFSSSYMIISKQIS